MKFIDAHCHLDDSKFKGDLDAVVQNAKDKGAIFLITSGVNPSTNRKVLELTKKYDIVKCSFGIYPVDVTLMHLPQDSEEQDLRFVEPFKLEDELKWIEEHLNDCVAIGEAGLDYKMLPKETTSAIQKREFKKVIDFCIKHDKPLVTHTRNAEEDAIDMLEESGIKKVQMHCFSGKKRLIRRCVDLGFFLSVPAIITRLEHFKTLVELVPLTQLLTETDAPYLSPVADTRNEPATIPGTIKEIAKIKGLSEEVVAEEIYKNTVSLFSLV